jgi:5-methylcytosine-specific restriction protein A
MAERWWAGDPSERYWLEATDREDIGADLKAPETDAGGRDNWRYTLFREANVGDVVFHYDGGRAEAIVGWSRIAGPAVSQPIVWAARGSYARERGDVPVEQPGYLVPLSDYTPLAQPITLDRLRAEKAHIADLVQAEFNAGHKPLYFPFELSQKRDLRPMQGYAFKLPAAFARLFPELSGASPRPQIATAAVSPKRNPPWSRDELILALDLYMTNPTSPPSHASAEVAALSETLSRMARVLGLSADDRFRNANGVYMKMMNFRRLDPAFTGMGMKGLTRGNKDEAIVWDEFAGDRARLAEVASAIRAAVESDEAVALASVDDDGIEEAIEGRVLTRLHRSRERNRALVATKKARALKQAGRLSCEVCSFDFGAAYGDRGHGFMEAHHTSPVHALEPGQATKLADLALVCANCHRMIHARRPWLSIEELRSVLSSR